MIYLAKPQLTNTQTDKKVGEGIHVYCLRNTIYFTYHHYQLLFSMFSGAEEWDLKASYLLVFLLDGTSSAAAWGFNVPETSTSKAVV